LKHLILILLFTPFILKAQEPRSGHFSAAAKEHLFVASDSLFDSNGGLYLSNQSGWRFHPGDDLNWANPDFDDSDWMLFNPQGLTEPIPDSLWNEYGWFRYRFAADSSACAMTTHLYFHTYGAAEVYLDGRLAQKYGAFSTELEGERRYMYNYKTQPAVVLQHGDSHVLAVRYSYHKGPTYKKVLGKYARTFGFDIALATDNVNQLISSDANRTRQSVYILGTMLMLIVLLHGFLFVMFPAERSNLYISIVVFLLFLHLIVIWQTLFFELDVLQKVLFRDIPYITLFLVTVSLFPFTICSMFNQSQRLIYKILIWLSPVFALANFILSGPNQNKIILTVFPLAVAFFSSSILIHAWKNRQKGILFVAVAFLGLIISSVTGDLYFIFSKNFKIEFNYIFIYMTYASIPLGLTAFMASRFRDLYTNLEQKVNERTRALNQSLEELKSTQSQLIQSEKMASLGQLTAGIAHEIQNPLNFVNNFSEVNTELIEEMKTELKSGNHEEAIAIANGIAENEKKINMHGKRADSIVKGMLQHSRSSSGVKELVDINKLADEFLRLSYHGLRAKDKSFNATMKSDFDSSIGRINIASDEIGRVILNLLNNAFYAVSDRKKRNPDGYEPTVSISTLKVGDQVEIKVQDNGIGIPQNVLDKIFQPFFTTKPTGQGAGLGLSLAYDIVKAHGGELKVETNEGVGSEFIIYLIIE